MQNQTVPTTIGALLIEECTIDPLSHLPSFLELTFVDVARNSGRKALSAAWGVGIAWLEGAMERLRHLENRLSDRTASRYRSSSSRFRLLRAIRALTIQLGRLRVRLLRRLCRSFLGTVKTLGPELQALIMYAIDYNCMHYLAGATACEMVYGLKRSKIVKAPPSPSPYHSPRLNKKSQSEEKLQLTNQTATGGAQYEYRVAELSKFEKTCSALFATLLPYCKDRCDRSFSEWKDEQSNNRGSPVYHVPNNSIINRSTMEQSKQNFVKLYPYVHMLHEGSIFIYQFAYLMGFTHHWSFSLHALGVMLRRMTVADVQQQQKQQQLQSKPKGGALPSSNSAPTQTAPLQSDTNVTSSTKQISLPTKVSIPQLLRGAVIFSVSYTLLSGWYSHLQRELRLRRRRWIAGDEDESPSQTREGETNEGDSRNRSHLPIPPPPMPPNVVDEFDQNIDKWSCPICKEPRINPTASTSGYVFCYKCLVSHIRQKGEYCPVTGRPCRENKVVRLYEPTDSRRGVAGGINNATDM